VSNLPTRGALAHLRVLDLTQFLSGPYGTQILADLGAEVIKVESPDGDLTRTLPPYFVAGDSAYFHSTNRNKKSVVIDLKNPGGQELVEQLVQKVDILIENNRPGVMKRLGLDYERLSMLNPGLIYCSVSGFGQEGPYRDHPAYDMIVQALSGGMSMTGEPGGPPVRTGIPLGDLAAGMYGVIGILAAVEERRVSGMGQYVDIAMLDCQISMLSYQGVYHLISGEVPGRQGRGHVSIPTYRAFTAADGADVVITANTEKMWRSLCAVLAMPELAEDPRFLTNRDRNQHRDGLWELLDRAFQTRSAAEWLPLLRDAGIPVAQVNTVEGALADPQVRQRNMVVQVSGEDGITMDLLGNPVKLSRSGEVQHRFPPHLGQDTREVLTDMLGLSDEEIGHLLGASVVAAHKGGE
jgi:CoA:oxalate CoA-transferase